MDLSRDNIYDVIFEHETWAGKAFDVALLVAVLLSVVVVILESVSAVRLAYGGALRAAEWMFTVIFTFEYALRLYAAPSRLRYATSFFGVIDLVAVVPTYVSLFVPGAQQLLVIRIFRLLRTFRVLKLVQYRSEAEALRAALGASLPKIVVFVGAVLSVVVITGATMHLIEGPEHGFDDIPRSMYWAIVTMTTVGYGDIAPGTTLGRGIASFIMILGYGVIAVPTGIVSAEMARQMPEVLSRTCRACGCEDHQSDAAFCRQCGAALSRAEPSGERPTGTET
ncbi:MAG: ion transporter [Myxococcota bacterium]